MIRTPIRLLLHCFLALVICLTIAPPGATAQDAPQGNAAVGTKEPDAKDAAAKKPFGIEQRVPWATSKFRGSPEPPLPYRAERVFPKLGFKNPTVLTSAPGTDRLFLAEQAGKIYSIPHDPQVAAADLFLDTEVLVKNLSEKDKEPLALEAVYGLTFHPKFAENRFCYLCYIVRSRDGRRGPHHPDGTRVSRLTVNNANPPRAEPDSEKLMISWMQGGHNGGCVKFGLDGCLYISAGDGGFAFPPDGRNAGQDVTNLLSTIMRIDVDHEQNSRPYTIPADNPFLSVKDARGEIWAFGLRNPWKMSFDRRTGDLWVGDVGWELWELVFRVRRGDNYGWSLYEGRQPVHAERQRGPAPIVPPTIEIPHTDGASVTGGFVYRGKKFPKLVGTYVFGDWETRRIWGVQVDGPQLGERREILEPTVRIVDFAEDNDGELYLLDYDDGSIHTIVENEARVSEHPFPRRLSETGLFAPAADHRLSAGVLPFSVNAEQWSDYASAERFIGIPGTGTASWYPRPKRIPGSMFDRTIYVPKDTVLGKTLSLEMQAGNPASRRRIETQVLHFDGRNWCAYTYEWNDEQSDAALVDAAGKARTVSIADARAANGRRQQTWRYSSRTECLRCHNPWSENLLAFNPAQLNRDHNYGSMTDNQLRTFRHIGLWEDIAEVAVPGAPPLAPPKFKSPDEMPPLVDPYSSSADLNQKARSYLHVNCAHCHRTAGGGSAYAHFNYDLPLPETKALGVRPTQGSFGIHEAKIVAPGDPFRSVLYFRMAKLGPGHMPHLGTAVVDRRGLELIHDWIRQLPPRSDDALLLERLMALDDAKAPATAAQLVSERTRLVGELLSNPGRAALLWHALQQDRLTEAVRSLAVAAAIKHTDPAVRDLFESFVPEEQRIKRLGDAIQPAELLKLAGSVERGRELFHKTAGVQCRNCHRISGDGTELGPELTQIGKKYDRAKLLESLLDPSKNIEPQFMTWLVETTSGKVFTGLLVRRDAAEIVLKDAQNKPQTIPMSEVEGTFPQQKSLMPELLLRDLTAQQVADLLEYLVSLK